MLPSLQKKPRPRRSYRHVPAGFHFLLEGNPHPLLIPAIVSQVSSYLPVSDLKCFRLVCKNWNDEATKALSKVGKISLCGEEDVGEYTRRRQHWTASCLQTQFELRGNIELHSPVVQSFFEMFGAQMKYVCFNRVKWKGGELKELLFGKLPNLEELGLDVTAYSNTRLFPESDDVVPEVQSAVLQNIKVLRLNIFSLTTGVATTPFLRDVLRACPNVKVISSLKKCGMSSPLPLPFIQYICQAMSYDTADDIVNMPTNLNLSEAVICEEFQLKELCRIDFNMRLRTHGVNQLALKGYPLRQLDMTVMSDVTSSTLQRLLQSVKGTLQNLNLKFAPGCPASEEFVTPELSHLNSLTLNGFKCSLKFLEQLPNLVELTFIRINLQRALGMEVVQFREPSQVKSFKVFEEFSTEGLAGDTIGLLACMFPQLKVLKLENMCDESMRRVLFEKSFSELEEVDFLNGFFTDAGVTGIKKCVLSSQNPEIGDLRCEDTPDISCLKQLRSLALGSPKLTDNSILYGVLHCKSLRRLHLLSYGITDISLLKLSSELDLFYLKTEYCFQLTEECVSHVKRRMVGRHLSLNEYTGSMKQSEIPKFMRRNGSVSVRLHKLDITKYPALPPPTEPVSNPEEQDKVEGMDKPSSY